MDVLFAGAALPSWTLAFLFLSMSLFSKVSTWELHLVDEWTKKDIELVEDEELVDFFFIFFVSIFHNVEGTYNNFVGWVKSGLPKKEGKSIRVWAS